MIMPINLNLCFLCYKPNHLLQPGKVSNGRRWASIAVSAAPYVRCCKAPCNPWPSRATHGGFGFHLGFCWKKREGCYTKPSDVGIVFSKKNIIRITTNKKKGREGKSRTWSGVQWSSSVTLCRIQNSFQGWWMWVDVNFELCYLCYIHVIISRFSQSSNSWYCDRTKSCTWNFLHVLGCRKSITFVDFVGIIPFNHSWNLWWVPEACLLVLLLAESPWQQILGLKQRKSLMATWQQKMIIGLQQKIQKWILNLLHTVRIF